MLTVKRVVRIAIHILKKGLFEWHAIIYELNKNLKKLYY